MGEEGPRYLLQVSCSPALGTGTPKIPTPGVARGGCRAEGLFSGPLLRLPVARNQTLRSSCPREAEGGSVPVRGRGRFEQQVLLPL